MVKAAKPYSQMGIYTAYVQTLNAVYFDNVQLFKEEFGHSYDYDSNGNLISVVDLQKNKTKYDYDSNNNLVKMTLPSGASQSYTYDSYHNVIKAVKAGSRTLISHSYTNDQNRRLSRSVYGIGDAVSYAYISRD